MVGGVLTDARCSASAQSHCEHWAPETAAGTGHRQVVPKCFADPAAAMAWERSPVSRFRPAQLLGLFRDARSHSLPRSALSSTVMSKIAYLLQGVKVRGGWWTG